MRLAHLSDLHFGREDTAVVDGLLRDLDEVRPDAVAISGDLTQRARSSEFKAARAFLDALPAPAVVVAGNHDVPVTDLLGRFTDPYRRYRQALGHELQPRLRADGLVALGLNTARVDTRKSGRLNASQVATLERTFSSAPPEALRVVVTHHPFIPPPQRPGASVIGRMPLALAAIERARVDLVLSGHRHVRHSRLLPTLGGDTPAPVLVVLAGTACSRRHRGEVNSYNLLAGDRNGVSVTVREWAEDRFAAGSTHSYVREEGQWVEPTGPPGHQ